MKIIYYLGRTRIIKDSARKEEEKISFVKIY